MAGDIKYQSRRRNKNVSLRERFSYVTKTIHRAAIMAQKGLRSVSVIATIDQRTESNTNILRIVAIPRTGSSRVRATNPRQLICTIKHLTHHYQLQLA